MHLLKAERSSRPLTHVPAAETFLEAKVHRPPVWKQFLRALLQAFAVGAA